MSNFRGGFYGEMDYDPFKCIFSLHRRFPPANFFERTPMQISAEKALSPKSILRSEFRGIEPRTYENAISFFRGNHPVGKIKLEFFSEVLMPF